MAVTIYYISQLYFIPMAVRDFSAATARQLKRVYDDDIAFADTLAATASIDRVEGAQLRCSSIEIYRR